MDLAVVAGGAAVCGTEREVAYLAVERRRLILLFPHDALVAFAVKVQDQPPAPLGSCVGVDVQVEAGRCRGVWEALVTGKRRNALSNTDFLADLDWGRSIRLLVGKQNVTVSVK